MEEERTSSLSISTPVEFARKSPIKWVVLSCMDGSSEASKGGVFMLLGGSTP